MAEMPVVQDGLASQPAESSVAPNPVVNNQVSQSTPSIMPPVQDLSSVHSTDSIMAHPIQAEAPIVQQQMSADEIALYDRQIRLWGVKAQEKLRSARILVVGMKALGNEVAKNLMLAGIGHLTVVDHENVTDDDLASQFLISEEHIGQNRAEASSAALQRLNPRVELNVDTTDISLKAPEFFSTFDITIALSSNLDVLNIINAACRISSRKFYAANTQGIYGYIFADLISHDFVIERSKSNVPTPIGQPENLTRSIVSATTKRESGKVIEVVTKREIYSPLLLANTSPLPPDVTRNRRKRLQVTPLLTCLRALFDYLRLSGGALPAPSSRPALEMFTKLAREKHSELQLPDETLTAAFLRSFLQNLGAELSPVAAFLGGSLAQDVINVLGQREQPLQNMLLFDGEESKGPIYSMHPIFDPVPTTSSNGVGISNGSFGDTADMNGSMNGGTHASMSTFEGTIIE